MYLPFVDVPKELRLDAMQAVVLLMPDENREALQTLLLFLHDVAQESSVNQVSLILQNVHPYSEYSHESSVNVSSRISLVMYLSQYEVQSM